MSVTGIGGPRPKPATTPSAPALTPAKVETSSVETPAAKTGAAPPQAGVAAASDRWGEAKAPAADPKVAGGAGSAPAPSAGSLRPKGKAPGTEAASECEATLQRAGACATEDVELSLEDCSDPVTEEPTYAATACEIVSEPQLAAECRFLSPSTEPPEEPAEPGAGGNTSSGESGAPGETPSEAGASAGGSGGVPTE